MKKIFSKTYFKILIFSNKKNCCDTTLFFCFDTCKISKVSSKIEKDFQTDRNWVIAQESKKQDDSTRRILAQQTGLEKRNDKLVRMISAMIPCNYGQ